MAEAITTTIMMMVVWAEKPNRVALDVKRECCSLVFLAPKLVIIMQLGAIHNNGPLAARMRDYIDCGSSTYDTSTGIKLAALFPGIIIALTN